MKINAHVIISGKVQGVFFRANTKKKAIEYGLTGWVKNTSDGCVEAVFEGEEDKLKDMIKWCKIGPKLSKVTSVKIKYNNFLKEYKDFKIIY